MEIYAKGQLSYLILNCLLERDYYGLDIISEIKDRSSGRILLKKPSVYSNLTRMEKQGQVSSYVQNSELGPNRKYYSITEKGRNTYSTLKDYFDRNGIDVFKDFSEEGVVETVKPTPILHPIPTKDEVEETQEESIEEVEQSDFFDFSSLETSSKQEVKEEPSQDDGKFLENTEPEKVETPQEKQYSIASLLRGAEPEKVEQPVEEPVKTIVQEEVYNFKEEEKKEPTQLSNQQIYDISKDINKYKRKRSFAEDQMAFAVSDPLARDDEKTKQNIEELKNSILANKGRVNERMSEDEFYKTRTPEKSPVEQPLKTNYYSSSAIKEETVEETKNSDDGVFIDQYMDRSQVAKARKIEPPRLKIIGEKETPLPAPKRDNSVDVSHKEIISKLYSKSKGANNAQAQDSEHYIYDYEDLQDFYNTQGISFKVYEKNITCEKHNTNKLSLISSFICMILSFVSSAVIFTALYLTGHALSITNFLYIVFPVLSMIECGYRFYAYKKHTSWEPKPMLSYWIVWVIALLSLGAIVGLNFAFGMTGQTFWAFANTLFLPTCFILIYLPLYYIIKKTMIIKHWK